MIFIMISVHFFLKLISYDFLFFVFILIFDPNKQTLTRVTSHALIVPTQFVFLNTHFNEASQYHISIRYKTLSIIV